MRDDSILIVDDDEDIIYLFKVALEEHGYWVETAVTGGEAIEKASKQRFSLVLLDHKLADIDGIQVADELIRMDKEIKIIFITGVNELKDRIKTDDVILDVILKPISESMLVDVVQDFFDSPSV
ncbi:MAG: response regulator [Candidatus Bathyarchaeota archaeon]|nr:response regulator [Candidatus Bathyarchaeota archaeon]